MSYYTGVIILSTLTLAILCILVIENNRLSSFEKRVRCINYGFLVLAALSEWLGYFVDGNLNVSSFLIRFAKFGDFTFTPIAGAIIALRFNKKQSYIKFINYLLIFNTTFQIICLFTDWMITVDANNYFHTSTLYPIYLVVCVIILFFIVLGFFTYGKGFKRRNLISLYAIMALLVYGIFIQEFFDNVRTAFVSMTIGMVLMYIHNTEFTQISTDEKIGEQNYLIAYDPLTKVYSRNEYNLALNELNSVEKLEEDFVAFSMDINGLKKANDTYGHEGGDEIICAAATCINEVFKDYGKCYRTGGDEFIVLANVAAYDIPKLLNKLDDEIANWKGQIVPSFSISVGRARAIEYPGLNVERLISKADQLMYNNKSNFYISSGIDRRNS